MVKQKAFIHGVCCRVAAQRIVVKLCFMLIYTLVVNPYLEVRSSGRLPLTLYHSAGPDVWIRIYLQYTFQYKNTEGIHSDIPS